MTASTMHFGPEWMRSKQQTPARVQAPPSPPTTNTNPPGMSTYSSLVSSSPSFRPEKCDEAHPFRYSKEEMLRIYKEGVGKYGLGLEVERWEGVVRNTPNEPISLRESTDLEKKLLAGPLNSEQRRRQSIDYLSVTTGGLPGERPRLNHTNSGNTSPMNNRFGLLRRRDSTDQPLPTLQRKLSLSGQMPLSPRDNGLPSPRVRTGFTPGLDGILAGGDSWVARRMGSEGHAKGGGSKTEQPRGDPQNDMLKAEIREEEEGEKNLGDLRSNRLDGAARKVPGFADTQSGETNIPSIPTLDSHSVSSNQPNSGVRDVNTNPTPSTISLNENILDPASVEWSYLDPQGQVQGPFRADLMQKWYEDGYFVPELPMKRTHLDLEWLAVGELARLAGDRKIFLSYSTSQMAPPGLLRHEESPRQGFAIPTNHNASNVPYQPSPIRTLRTSALESYVGSGSNPSDSPSSSYSTGRFNGSPDPNAFGGRAGNGFYSLNDTSGSHLTGVSLASDLSGGFSEIRRGIFNESVLDPSRTSNFTAGPVDVNPSIDQFSSATYPHAPLSSWTNLSENLHGMPRGGQNQPELGPYPGTFTAGVPNNFSGAFNQAYNYGRGPQANNFDLGLGSSFQNGELRHLGEFVNDRDIHGAGSDAGLNNQSNEFGNAPFPHSYSQPLPYSGQQPARPQTHAMTIPSAPSHPPPLSFTGALGSPWLSQESTSARRLGPFEAPHPTSANTTIVALLPPPPPPSQPPSQPQPDEAPARPVIPANASPWFVASHATIDEKWGAPSQTSSESLVEQPQVALSEESTALGPQTPPEFHDEPLPEVVVLQPGTSNNQSAKARRKANNQATAIQAQSAKEKSVVEVAKLPSSPSAAQPKPAWSVDEDSKKTTATSVSLREIQQAEAKKVEARKAVEREREKTARTAEPPTSSSEETQSFIASWGLPTSQAGTARMNTHVIPSAAPSASSSASTSTPAVGWTNAAKIQLNKKSMKEIQEEEKRMKSAVKETAAAVAAKRYADTTTKTTPAPALSAWTTVGASGKTAAIIAPSTRPSLTPSSSSTLVSTSSSASRLNGTPAVRPATAAQAKQAASPPPRIEERPVAPSIEFVKWVGDSLKGLNSSANAEEIVSMLLSFPVDPDPSTAEIISDLIYANSTVLDGRRFATEFLSKRKADAATRPKGSGVAGIASNPVSIADVVKTRPKPAQADWGGFKVVNKKKKNTKN